MGELIRAQRCTVPRAEQLISPQVKHQARAPFVVLCGAGVNSTAMLVAMWRRAIRPDLILFADIGAEKPETYAYLPVSPLFASIP